VLTDCVDSQKKLVTWLRILLRNTWLIEYYYQPWSYVVKTGPLSLTSVILVVVAVVVMVVVVVVVVVLEEDDFV